MKKVLFKDLGRMAYKAAWDLQEKKLSDKSALKQAKKNDLVTSELLFVEHPPVYTLGRNGHEENVLINQDELAKRGIEYFHVNRGGDVTFHGAGQIVCYPIFDLEQFKTDLNWYLRSLEETVIRAIAEYGIIGERSKGETGVWIEPQRKGYERKICAMGVRCSRWITMHGFALNVNTDLDYFKFIVPCGIQGKQVTSMQKELGKKTPVSEVKQKLKRHFCEVFDIELSEI